MAAVELDEELIRKTALGDRSAFRELYEKTAGAVYGFALSIVKNREDAEDVMHDVFLSILEKAASYEPRGKPMAWILTMVRNESLNTLRHRRTVPADPAAGYEDRHADGIRSEKAPSPEESAEQRLLLSQALRVLDDEERQVIILHAMVGWKHRETAALLGIPLSTVLSKYRRALMKMQGAMEERRT